MSSNFMGDL